MATDFVSRAIRVYETLHDCGVYSTGDNPWGLGRWFVRECAARGLEVGPSTVGRWMRGEINPASTPLGEEALYVLALLEDRAQQHLLKKLAALNHE